MSELVYYDLKSSASMAPSLPVQVARELGRRIVAGTFEVGSLMDEEGKLSERFQVSRVVIRDAIKILVSKGLLDVRRGIGTKVRPRDQWILWDDDVLAWHIAASPNPEFLKQLMDIRIAFEPKAARWAAQRGSMEAILNIEKAVIKMELEKNTTEKFIVADALFHKAVLCAANNEFLNSMEGVIYSALLMSVNVTNRDTQQNEATIAIHRQVFEAIQKSDGDLAEKLTEQLLSEAAGRLCKDKK
ncbi:GntR family transcriptional regulator [Catenovulum agarivorans DS-2]|uniref:GntR family transcriptional regulator n=1 Tax=Catenovulum agarivorans DS-2 TaxID=1328313 RepID=W7QMT6_9ALTE|nr:FadR/GntR family transcriptional regulator [Catenovulum agarivorans]EWH10257.1 GntR family transcriptional regulator [Catenovulum agarivorans DS-2]